MLNKSEGGATETLEQDTQNDLPSRSDDTESEEATSSLLINDPETLAIFTEEYEEETRNIQEKLQVWGEDHSDQKALEDIRRSYHTLKGSGRIMGATALGDYAWAYEDLLNQVISKHIPISTELLEHVNTSVLFLQDNQQKFLVENHLSESTLRQVNDIQNDLVRITLDVSDDKQSSIEETLSITPSPESVKAITDSHDEKTPQTFTEQVQYHLLEMRKELSNTLPSREKLLEQSNIIRDISQSLKQEGFFYPFDLLSKAIENDKKKTPLNQIKSNIEGFIAQAESSIQNVENSLDPTENIAEDLIQESTPEAELSKQKAEDAEAETGVNHTIFKLFQSDLPELLESIDNAMLSIHHEPENKQNISELERQLHTLKGGARMVDSQELADISHTTETLLNDIGDGTRVIDATTIDTLQTAVDKIQNLSEVLLLDEKTALPNKQADVKPAIVNTFHFEVTKPKEGYRSLLEQVLAEQKDSLPEVNVIESSLGRHDNSIPEALSSTRETIRLPAIMIDKMVGLSTEININQTQLTEHLQHFDADIDELMMTATRLHNLLRSLELETEEQIRHSYALEHGKPLSNTDAHDQFDPLEMDQYSEIQQLSRFIQEGLNDLGSIEKNLSTEQNRIKQVLKQQSQISREMQQELLATRLTEVSVILPRLRRITRQTAESLGKQINFEVEGEQCELDRVVLQKITSPLEHMLRNAISHGIELPKDRVKASKPEAGKINFTVQRDGAEIVMTLSDDGQGINKDSVRKKAVSMGIIPKDKKLTDSEILRLTFHAGLSTTKSLNQISGRGVGMDVAYSDIKNMGGSLHVDSSQQGTKFTIRLPLTLATNQVLIAEVAGEQYGIPMSGIVALQRVPNLELQTYFDQEQPEITYNKQTYRLQHLSDVLKQPTLFDGSLNAKSPILFLNVGKQRVAYHLDKIIGNREVVIKPLSSMLHTSLLYSSATIQTDGRVILILNTSELVHFSGNVATETKSNKKLPVKSNEYPTVMIVDDSITIRKITENLLESNGYQVLLAKDGMHALEKLNSDKPDIMLLDIEMPRMDGFELLSNLRNSEEWKHLPVIMISSRTGEKHRKRAESLGISRFLGKPYQEGVLLESIKETLYQHAEEETV